MKMNRIRGMAFTFILQVLAAAGFCAEPLTMKDSGKTVNLSQGNELEIQLAGNPTTGYGWSVTECDSNIVQPDSKPQYTPDSDLMGSGGLYRFIFKAVSTGETALTLAYRRPWETNTPPIETFGIRIQVSSGE